MPGQGRIAQSSECKEVSILTVAVRISFVKNIRLSRNDSGIRSLSILSAVLHGNDNCLLIEVSYVVIVLESIKYLLRHGRSAVLTTSLQNQASPR